MSEQEHDEKLRELKAYLIDGFTFLKNGKSYCGFALSITNLSSVTKSLPIIELQVEYTVGSGETGKAILNCEIDISPPYIKPEYQKLTTPINIPSKETVSGWITFRKPIIKNMDLNIKEYKIIGMCNEKRIEIVSAYLLRCISNEKDEG
ncbi:hypothetical protein [Vreelandella titanicae]|uniref:hypothetical protein n=1 Tax=Vreelandella titanicae TaxID=664683 RepID=UPI003D2701F7